jgi:hypothetical protein
LHFLPALGSGQESFFISAAPESTDRFFFFLSFLFKGFDTLSVRSVSEPDSKASQGWGILGAEEMKGVMNCRSTYGRGRLRLLLARFTGMMILVSKVVGFSTELELLLSRTETGLEVWKRRKPLPSEPL